MKNCTRCKYAEWKKTASGKLHPSGEGRCNYPWKMPKLPQAFYWIFHGDPIPSGGYINRRKDFEEHCPYYQEAKP